MVSNPIVRRKEICIKHIEKASKIFFLISIMAVSFFAPLKSFQLKWLIDSNSKKEENIY